MVESLLQGIYQLVFQLHHHLVLLPGFIYLIQQLVYAFNRDIGLVLARFLELFGI